MRDWVAIAISVLSLALSSVFLIKSIREYRRAKARLRREMQGPPY